METIHVATTTPYDVIIGNRILSDIGFYIKELGRCRTAAVFSDDIVDSLYGQAVQDSLTAAGFSCFRHVVPHGEQSKRIANVMSFTDAMASHGMTRSDIVIALGGGVPGDMAGFAAAVYLRGIRYVQVPTTLLAAVDSSIGGKTAVDTEAGKNMVGAFHQPSLVLCDTATLDTQPEMTARDGMAEVIKYGAILSAPLLDILCHRPVRDTSDLICRCVTIKRDIVCSDEFDRGQRRLLNFGHTIGHAIERISGYTVSHGAAVACGMVRAARMGAAAGLEDCSGYLAAMASDYGFDTECPFAADLLYGAALADKKRGTDGITLVLPESYGRCGLHTIPEEQLLTLLRETE